MKILIISNILKFELTLVIADVSQGTQDIEYGWNGDSTTPSSMG